MQDFNLGTLTLRKTLLVSSNESEHKYTVRKFKFSK